MSTAARFFGETLGTLMMGVPANRFEFEKEAADAMDEIGEDFHRQTARLVKLAYEMADRRTDFGYHLYATLEKTASWEPAYGKLMGPAYKALAMVLGEPTLVKQANPFQTLAAAFPAALQLGSTGMRALLTTGIASGGALGALHWGMNRHVTEDEKENEELKARIELYNRVTDEINDELARKGISPR